MNPKEILDSYSYEGTKELEKRVSDYMHRQGGDPEALIDKIVLWKVGRQAFLSDEIIHNIVTFQNDSILDERIIPNGKIKGTCWEHNARKLIISMINCKGIGLPMASTILHFFHPKAFLIIDQRAYREVMGKNAPTKSNGILYASGLYTNDIAFYGLTDDELVDTYIEYLEGCIEYYKKNNLDQYFEFSELDKYTYRVDKLNKNKVTGY